MKELSRQEMLHIVRGGAISPSNAEFWGRWRYFAELYPTSKNNKANNKDGKERAKGNATGVDKVYTILVGFGLDAAFDLATNPLSWDLFGTGSIR